MAKTNYRLETNGRDLTNENDWLPSCDGPYDNIKDGLIMLRYMQAAADYQTEHDGQMKLTYRLIRYEVIAQ